THVNSVERAGFRFNYFQNVILCCFDHLIKVLEDYNHNAIVIVGLVVSLCYKGKVSELFEPVKQEFSKEPTMTFGNYFIFRCLFWFTMCNMWLDNNNNFVYTSGKLDEIIIPIINQRLDGGAPSHIVIILFII
ncbi:hypothetical protein ACJX0J_021422, partial [Zea mays]